jgi:hypothetical protein
VSFGLFSLFCSIAFTVTILLLSIREEDGVRCVKSKDRTLAAGPLPITLPKILFSTAPSSLESDQTFF